MKLSDIPRNDVRAALRYWREHRRDRDRLALEPLFMLFDDPEVLRRAIAKEERSA